MKITHKDWQDFWNYKAGNRHTDISPYKYSKMEEEYNAKVYTHISWKDDNSLDFKVMQKNTAEMIKLYENKNGIL